MKNNLNKNIEMNQKKYKDSLKQQKQNILYKSYNYKQNKIKTKNSINTQELSDIKSIVKNSVEKIYDLFNLQEMKESSRILSKKSNEINSFKNNLNINENEEKALFRYNEEDNKIKDKKFMKTNITFKINNYLSVLNKNKNEPNDDNNNGTLTNCLEDENSYIQKKYKIKENPENYYISNSSNNYNKKINKNKKKELIKNKTTSSDFYKNEIKNNILLSSKKNKKSNNILDNNNFFTNSPKNVKINFENNYSACEENNKNKMEETNSIINDKSIVVNTKIKKIENTDFNKNNYIIRPTRISHINKEEEITMINKDELNINQLNETNSRNRNKTNSEKKKKYTFLKRTKSKNKENNNEKNLKRNLIFGQKKSKTKYQFDNARINENFHNTINDFYSKKEKKLYKNKKNIYTNNYDNKIKNLGKNKKSINNIISKKNEFCTNMSSNKKINKNSKYNATSSFKKSFTNKNIFNSRMARENIFNEISTKILDINNLLISNLDNSNYSSQKSKSDNKLRISTNKKMKNYSKSNLFSYDNDINKIPRNQKNIFSSPKLIKDKKLLDLIDKKDLFNIINKKEEKLKREQIRNILQKLYDSQFPNKVLTNDIIKLFLLLNEYLINNNLLSDYNIKDNKIKLNKLSEFLSKNSSIDYPKEFDINIDNYINKVKVIQRAWRKFKIKGILGKNEEMHELKKIVVNKYITRTGYKMKKIIGLFNSMIEDFNNIKKSDDINRMFYYVKNLIKRDLTNYEKNVIYKEFINNFINIK